MKTTPFRIYTKDNIELFGLLYEPETETKKVVVFVHGMSGNFYENLFLDSIASTLTSNGIAFITFNNRGCELIKDLYKVENGKRSIVRIGNAFELFDDCLLDIRAAIDFAESKSFAEIHLSGHSLGCPKIAYYASEGDKRLNSVLFLSPSDMVALISADKDYERDITVSKQMIAEGKGAELLPFPVLWDQSQISAQSYISLATRESNVSIFHFKDKQNTLPVLSKITIPALTVMGRKDDALVVPIEETMERVKKAMLNSTQVILGDADHGYNGYEQQLADTIKDWILK